MCGASLEQLFKRFLKLRFSEELLPFEILFKCPVHGENFSSSLPPKQSHQTSGLPSPLSAVRLGRESLKSETRRVQPSLPEACCPISRTLLQW